MKSLGGRRVADGVDLACAAGHGLGLLGPGGAGETTADHAGPAAAEPARAGE